MPAPSLDSDVAGALGGGAPAVALLGLVVGGTGAVAVAMLGLVMGGTGALAVAISPMLFFLLFDVGLVLAAFLFLLVPPFDEPLSPVEAGLVC